MGGALVGGVSGLSPECSQGLRRPCLGWRRGALVPPFSEAGPQPHLTLQANSRLAGMHHSRHCTDGETEAPRGTRAAEFRAQLSGTQVWLHIRHTWGVAVTPGALGQALTAPESIPP